MTNRFKTCLATLGVAVLTTASGTAMPTASTPDMLSGDSTGAATALFNAPGRVPQPEQCTSQLVLSKVASSRSRPTSKAAMSFSHLMRQIRKS